MRAWISLESEHQLVFRMGTTQSYNTGKWPATRSELLGPKSQQSDEKGTRVRRSTKLSVSRT